MFKFSPKQKLAIKSWFHAMIPLEVAAFMDYAASTHESGTLFVKGAALALLAPITRWLATLYSKAAVKYPWLKPIAAYLAKRASKELTVKLKLNYPDAKVAIEALNASKPDLGVPTSK